MQGEDPVRKGEDESPQILNISAFYTLMKQAFGLYAQEQGYPVPVTRINGSESAQTPPMNSELLAIQRASSEDL